MNPLVSVIVPCYNVESYIHIAIESLIANDYPSKQIIFVDDGSTDRTISILNDYKERYPDII